MISSSLTYCKNQKQGEVKHIYLTRCQAVIERGGFQRLIHHN